jgi:hypothetical protein
MRMVQSRSELYFPLKPTCLDSGGQVGWQDFDYDVAIETNFFGHEDPAHPCATELAKNLVVRAESHLELTK